VGLGRFHPAGFEAASGQEPGDGLGSGAAQQAGGVGEIGVGRKGREAPERGGGQWMPGGS
jgi:hypothetical protein